MEFVFNAINGPPKLPSPEDVVSKLADTISFATLLEDRRAAVLALRGLAKDCPLAVGTKAMAGLVAVLGTDARDPVIVRAAIETLAAVCTASLDDLGTMFSEIYTKEISNVSILLDMLQETEFYVRYSLMQFLGALFLNSPKQLQAGILASPMGISRLMDLLGDSHEILRNEGILLLNGLTRSNADIQKIVAFENAFDRLFAIIIAEGGVDGGIVAQDCLQLMDNLLRFNVSNQNLFRENDFVKRIPQLLLVHDSDFTGTTQLIVPIYCKTISWDPQKITNTLHVLAIIVILTEPNTSNLLIIQNLLGKSDLMATVFNLATMTNVPLEIRTLSLQVVADIIRNNPSNQSRFAGLDVSGFSVSGMAVKTTVEVSLKKEHFSIRAAACYLFQSYLYQNPVSQCDIIRDLKFAWQEERMESVSMLLIRTLLDQDSITRDPCSIWLAANMLMHILNENEECKQLALINDPKDDISTLDKIMYVLLATIRESLDLRATVAILCLTAVWLYDCRAAINAFLVEGSNMQLVYFLVMIDY